MPPLRSLRVSADANLGPCVRVPITVIVLTFNENRNLDRCLQSLRCASEVVVVDSFSTDNTCEIAMGYTSRVVQHEYVSHPAQWQWILENVPVSNDWVFAVDADFEVTEQVWRELAARLTASSDLVAYHVRHAQMFRGRLLRHGTMYPRHWLRIFRKDAVIVDSNDRVDLHFRVPAGKAGYIEGDVIEDNVNDRSFSFWIQKQLRFAKRQAAEEVERFNSTVKVGFWKSLTGTQNERILFLKQMWFRLPHYIRPFLFFIYRYFFRLGFLDGKPGLVYHFTQALFYRLAVDVYLENDPGDCA